MGYTKSILNNRTFTITGKAAALEFRDAFLGAAKYLESLS